MARIKRVFSNSSECIHIWANRIQGYGRSSNVSFRSSLVMTLLSSEDDSDIGDVLYSYYRPIAAFRESAKGLVVFLNDYSYSHTTQKHQKRIRSAVTQPIFDYDNIPKWVEREVNYVRSSPQTVEPSAIWQQYHDIFDALVATVGQKRFSRTSCERLNMAREYEAKANRIKRAFNLDSLPDIELIITPQMQEYVDLAEQKKAEKEARAIEKHRLEIERSESDRVKWLQGIGNYYPHSYSLPIALRLSPHDAERVETSRGAFVPVKVCERLYRAFKARQMPDNLRVGNYTLNEVSEQGLTIGCHKISADELERFAAVIGIA